MIQCTGPQSIYDSPKYNATPPKQTASTLEHLLMGQLPMGDLLTKAIVHLGQNSTLRTIMHARTITPLDTCPYNSIIPSI